jgi:hypothetical protein
MEQRLFKEEISLTPEEIRDNLEAQCDSTVEGTYMRSLNPEERKDVELDLSAKTQEISELEAKLKIATNPIKEQIKKAKSDQASLLYLLKEDAEEVEGVLYEFYDHEKRRVGQYDAEGILVNTRPMNIEERQYSLGLKVSRNG